MQDITKVVTLHKDETLMMRLRQSYLSSITPDTLLLTNKRVIIIHNSFWGRYTGHNLMTPTRVSAVLLGNVMGTTKSHGKLLSTIQIRIRGMGETSEGPYSGWHIDGIRTKDAMKFTDMLEDLLGSISGEDTDAEITLGDAKEKIANGSYLMWLGIESSDYISYLLGIDRNSIIRVNPLDIPNMSMEGMKDFEGKVFLCYTGSVSSQMVRVLRAEYKVHAFYVRGGLNEAMKAKGPQGLSRFRD